MTMPAASPTSMTLSLTVRGGGPRTGTKPPVALPGSRWRSATNLSNSSRKFPRNRSHVPRPTFAHPAFGMIHAYPPGARLPKNMSVASLNSPSAVAPLPGADTGRSPPTDLAAVGHFNEIVEFGDGREDRADFLVVGDIFATLDRHADLLALVDQEDLQAPAGRVPGRRGSRGSRADDDDVVRRGHRSAPSPVAGEDVIDE